MRPIRIWVLMAIASIAIGMTAACTTKSLQLPNLPQLPPGEETMSKIQAGMKEKAVRSMAGEPDRVVQSRHGARILYYRENLMSNCDKDLDTCTPVVIERGRVAAIGHPWMNAWVIEKTEAERKKKNQNAVVTAIEPADSEPALKLKTGDAASTKDTATRKEIARLEKQVRRIPYSRTMDNLNIYRYLLKLDPDNPRYRKKVAFYEAQLERDKEKRAKTRQQEAEIRKAQNKSLKQLQGNRTIHMGLENLGSGRFYVWLKNVGSAPIRVTPRHFILVCTNGKSYTVYQTKDFNRDIQPGQTLGGRVAFDVYCPPRELVFLHPTAGKTSRKFPKIDLDSK